MRSIQFYPRSRCARTRVAAGLVVAAVAIVPAAVAWAQSPVSWTGAAGGGSWANGGNWNGGQAPGFGALVGAAVENATTQGITLSAGTAQISSLVTAGLVTLTGSSATATTILDLSGGALSFSGTSGGLFLNNATLRNTLLTDTSRLTFSTGTAGRYNILDGVTLGAGQSLSLGNGFLRIVNGFTYDAGATFNVGAGGRLQFDGTHTLDNATVNLGTATAAGNLEVGRDSSLTLGPNLDIQGKNARIAFQPVNTPFESVLALTNRTSLVSDEGGTWFVGSPVQKAAISNEAEVRATGAGSSLTISSYATVSNSGMISATGGGRLVVSVEFTTFNNSGTVRADGAGSEAAVIAGVLNNTGVFRADNGGAISIGTASASAALGTVIATNGSQVNLGHTGLQTSLAQMYAAAGGMSGGSRIDIQGLLDLSGGPLDPGSLLGGDGMPVPVALEGSYAWVRNGTIVNPRALRFSSDVPGAPLLENVTLDGTDGLGLADNFDGVRIKGTFRFGAGTTFDVPSGMGFETSYTLDKATVNLGNGGNLYAGLNATLTLGPELVVNGRRANFATQSNDVNSQSGWTLVNNTLLSSDEGGQWDFGGSFRTTVTNRGTIEAKGTGSRVEFNQNTRVDNLQGATLRVTDGATMGLDGAFVLNAGSVFVGAGSTLSGFVTLLQSAPIDQDTQAPREPLPVFTVDGTVADTRIDIRNGTLQGDGTVAAVTNNGGTLSPGRTGGIGSLDATTYTQGAAGRMLVEMAFAAPGGVDFFDVRAQTAIDGFLDVKLLGGFQPQVGDQVRFMRIGGTLTDNLLTVNPLDPGYTYSVFFEGTPGNLFGVLRVDSAAVAVPEPGSGRLVIGGVFALGGVATGVARRRRRATA